MSEKDFKFYVPVELVKGEKEGEEEWRVEGIASTPDEDLQGETVAQEGLDISMLKAGRGLFNYDHQKGPENVLGQIEDANFIDQNGKKCLMVKGYLFKQQERAKAFYNILRSVKKANGPRVHMSIEGKILKRDFNNSKAIKQARIDKVALTLDPVNPYTYAELVKSLNASESDDMATQVSETVNEISKSDETVTLKKTDVEALLDFAKKALAAGIGSLKAPGDRVGGEAMTREDLESDVKPVTYGNAKRKKKKKLDKSVVESLIDSLCKAHPNEDPRKLASLMVEVLVEKLDEE